MNKNPNTINPAQMPDPRPGLATAASAVQALIATVETSDFSKPTPCTEFDVQALLDHITMVFRRSEALGKGQHFSSVQQTKVGDDIDTYIGEITAAAAAQKAAWADGSRLGTMIEVPWGTLPGGAILATYTAELATHGWDLATALGQDFSIPDDALNAALFAVHQIPAEGREAPEIPFDPVVDPGPGASVLHQLVGWAGRAVI